MNWECNFNRGSILWTWEGIYLTDAILYEGGSILRTRGCMRGSDFSTGQGIISREVFFFERKI
jgi:hypothetical protein